MRKLFVILVLATAFCSCSTTSSPLYYWGGYEYSFYKYYKERSPESCVKLYSSYANMYNYYQYVTNPEAYQAKLQENVEKGLMTDKDVTITLRLMNHDDLRKTMPPGMCAEYGYMLLSPDTPEILQAYFKDPNNYSKRERKAMEKTGHRLEDIDWDQVYNPAEMRKQGVEMLQLEMELYPESTTFLTPIIKNLSQQ